MSPRRRRNRGPSRCRDCHLPIKWLVLRGAWVRFEPRPVDGRTHTGAQAYATEGARAWPLPSLVDELMGRREITEAQARDEAYDMPWHHVHVCATAPTTQEPADAAND